MRNTVNAPSRNILSSVYRIPFIIPLLGRIGEYITGGTTAVYLAHSTLAKIGGKTDGAPRRVSRRNGWELACRRESCVQQPPRCSATQPQCELASYFRNRIESTDGVPGPRSIPFTAKRGHHPCACIRTKIHRRGRILVLAISSRISRDTRTLLLRCISSSSSAWWRSSEIEKWWLRTTNLFITLVPLWWEVFGYIIRIEFDKYFVYRLKKCPQTFISLARYFLWYFNQRVRA